MVNVPFAEHTKKMLFRERYRIPSARLKNWDYTTPGYYFVTICTKDKHCWLGDIRGIQEEPWASLQPSEAGKVVASCWEKIPEHYKNVALDQHIIMPNHFHGILSIEKQDPAVPLGLIVNQFKAASTKHIRGAGHHDFAWQARFYDHII
ncbi:MAG: hypothetical protein AAB853_00485 [Patescibacteria group bacterium]